MSCILLSSSPPCRTAAEGTDPEEWQLPWWRKVSYQEIHVDRRILKKYIFHVEWYTLDAFVGQECMERGIFEFSREKPLGVLWVEVLERGTISLAGWTFVPASWRSGGCEVCRIGLLERLWLFEFSVYRFHSSLWSLTDSLKSMTYGAEFETLVQATSSWSGWQMWGKFPTFFLGKPVGGCKKNRGLFFIISYIFFKWNRESWTGFGAYHPYQKRIVEFV